MANKVLTQIKDWLKEQNNIDQEKLDIIVKKWLEENKSEKVIEIDKKVRELYVEVEALYKRLMDEMCNILVLIFEYDWTGTYIYKRDEFSDIYTIHPKTRTLEIGTNYILEDTEMEIEYNIERLNTEEILDLILPKLDFIEIFPEIIHKVFEEYLDKFDMYYQDLSKKYWELVNTFTKKEV